MGAAANRARVRGQIRPPAGRSVPSCGRLSPMASRQAATRVPLRSARGHHTIRAREGVRRRAVKVLQFKVQSSKFKVLSAKCKVQSAVEKWQRDSVKRG